MPITAIAQTVNGDYEYQTHMSDPIEPINRVIWDFNYLFFFDTFFFSDSKSTRWKRIILGEF